MRVMISMLRGINVGGRNQIRMDALRKLYESLDLHEPQTYVQSGNVVFKTTARDTVVLTQKIEHTIEKTFGFRTDVVLRTSAQLKDAIAKNPFAERKDADPSKLLVTFLAKEPQSKLINAVLSKKNDREKLHILGRELYIYFPNGMGGTKLNWLAVVKALGTTGTGRNLNSVMKLLEIAERMEASA